MSAVRHPVVHPSAARLATLLVAIGCAGGCTSAISTAYLRDTFWNLDDTALPAEGSAADSAPKADEPPEAPLDAERRAAAIEEAVERLARLGTLDDATRATLVETLERTQQEDWPVVVEAFAASLESTGGLPRPDEPAPDDAATHVVAKAEVAAALPAPSPVPQPAPVSQPAPEPVSDPTTAAEPPPATSAALLVSAPAAAPVLDATAPGTPLPAPTTPVAAPSAPAPAEPVAGSIAPRSLAIGGACFASRVAGWGTVDRFPTDRFHPGQEVIVYVELDHLAADVSRAGHTTCIDAALRLVGPDGRVAHAWAFEPIAETCAKPRRDYFARYVVRMPETAPPGGYRVEVAITDTVAGVSASTELPLEIVAAVSAR